MPETPFRRVWRVRAIHTSQCPSPRVLLAAFAGALLLSGCVVYHAKPLPRAPQWQASAPAATQPLTLDLATQRALRDNPGFKADLLGVGVSAQQLRGAGLLPDPQFGATLDRPITPGYTNGWSLGLTEDLSTLVTHGAVVDAARARLAQTRLEVLWQGWTLAQKTANDYVALWDARQRVALLSRQVKALASQQQALDAALAGGYTTRQQQAAALTTLSQAQAQLSQARQDRASARLTLDEDIGAPPSAHFQLEPPPVTPLPPQTVVDRALKSLPDTRPDLLALNAGYRAADADLRAAVLAQFPGISVNINRASDTSAVKTNGFGINLNLPVFGSAQAHARIARATREQLYAAYQARLDSADSQARALYARLREVQRRAQALHKQLKPLRELARQATVAFRAGNFSAAEWSSVQDNLIAREIESLQTRARLATGQVALAALLGQARNNTQTDTHPKPDPNTHEALHSPDPSGHRHDPGHTIAGPRRHGIRGHHQAEPAHAG